MDRVSRKKRSEIMSKIKGRDTLPERIMFTLLKELQTPPERWSNLPGKPDFVFEAAGIVVFVDGCFFHRCPVHSSNPKTNVKFWKDKFSANTARDKRVNMMLRENGWDVYRFWECHIKRDPDDVLYLIETAVEEKMADQKIKDAKFQAELDGHSED